MIVCFLEVLMNFAGFHINAYLHFILGFRHFFNWSSELWHNRTLVIMTIFEEWNVIYNQDEPSIVFFFFPTYHNESQKNICWCLFSVMWQGFSKFVYIWGKKKNDKNSHQSFFPFQTCFFEWFRRLTSCPCGALQIICCHRNKGENLSLLQEFLF